MVDVFVTQFDGCNYLVDGRPSQGKNCTCAAEAMYLYRASQGRIRVTSCQVRMRTGDRFGGNHLGQMEQVSHAFGITEGKVYRPITAASLLILLKTGRYGTHWNGSYSVMVGTPYDALNGRFRGNHDWYVSGIAADGKTLRVGDPARRAGYQSIPTDLMLRAAARLDLGDGMLGTGKVYAYITPPDPIPKAPHYRAVVTAATALWNDTTKRWVFNGANAIPKGTILEVRGKPYPKGGLICYPTTSGECSTFRPGYYVPTSKVKLDQRCD